MYNLLFTVVQISAKIQVFYYAYLHITDSSTWYMKRKTNAQNIAEKLLHLSTFYLSYHVVNVLVLESTPRQFLAPS